MALDPNQIIDSIAFVIATGGDDCRSDSIVFADIVYKFRPADTAILKDQGTTWGNGYTAQVEIQLLTGTRAGEIDHINIRFAQGGGGWNGDNWNMNDIEVWAPVPDGDWALVYQKAGDPLKRFTGSDVLYVCPWTVAPSAAERARMLSARRIDGSFQIYRRPGAQRSAA